LNQNYPENGNNIEKISAMNVKTVSIYLFLINSYYITLEKQKVLALPTLYIDGFMGHEVLFKLA